MVAAIEGYQAETGLYPATLQQLVPPLPENIDQRWVYTFYGGGDAVTGVARCVGF